jgi:hypothetical protein
MSHAHRNKITHASLGLLLSDRSSLDNVTSQAIAHDRNSLRANRNEMINKKLVLVVVLLPPAVIGIVEES